MSHRKSNVVNGDEEQSAQEMVSKRLVDYFVVYSCEPRRRETDQNRDKHSFEGQLDEAVTSDDKTSESAVDPVEADPALCTPERQKLRHASLANPTRSPDFERRVSTRAAHFKVAPDGGIAGEKTGGIDVDQEETLVQNCEDTPLISDSDMSTGDSDTDISFGSNDDMALTPSLRSNRVPVAAFVKEEVAIEDKDVGKNCKDENNGSEPESKTPPRHKTEEEILTPSRARGMYSDSETEEENKDESQEKEDGDGNVTESDCQDGVNESQNIHLPNDSLDIAKDGQNSLLSTFTITPVKTAQYPQDEHDDCPFNPMVSHFCFPEALTPTTEYHMPRIHYFVLTNDKGKKMYGTCLTVWETFTGFEHSDELLDALCRKSGLKEEINAAANEQNVEVSLSSKKPSVYIPKVLCILSSWPYLQSFREYLGQLYRLATLTNLMTVPIERYILNLCSETPAPPPGIFEVRLKIFSSTLKFWAPSGGLPIAHVAIPFKILFECLDLNNVLFVWYALTLERKVLLVSSKCSLLTICSEILLSLLFPMEWSHLYIPTLPKFLSPMLDAPMPYLCGITRQNFNHAVGDISDETIVVDLDQNLITRGDKSLPFPGLPLKRRSKLEKTLKLNAGDVFWEARGLKRADIMNQDSQVVERTDLQKTAVRVWKEKLRGYDDAFNLAYTPDSETLLNGDSRLSSYAQGSDEDIKQSSWDSVQEAFLRFYVSMLRDYKKYISVQNGNKTFKTKQFISSQKAENRLFLREFCTTQQFDCFITKRMYEPKAPDVLFFDQSITAKKNRSKMTLKKKETPFLVSAKAHKRLRKVEVQEPKEEVNLSSNLMDQLYAVTGEKKTYVYETWPEKLIVERFRGPRPIPPAIAAEFERIDNIANNFKRHSCDAEAEDFRPGPCHPSIEVATLTVFFVTYCKITGSKFEMLRNQLDKTLPRRELSSRIKRTVETETNGSSRSLIQDCTGTICSPCGGRSGSKNTITSETVAILKPLYSGEALDDISAGYGKTEENNSENLLNNNNSLICETEVEAAELLAGRQLDLAFSVMETVSMRALPADQDALKALMEACGRCGSTIRATQLITMMKQQYIQVDAEIYSNYLTTFSVANEIHPDEVIKSPLTNVPLRSFDPSLIKIEAPKVRWFHRTSKVKRMNHVTSEHSFTNETHSETSSTSAISDSSAGNHRFQRSSHTYNRKQHHGKGNELLTTETVQRSLVMGDCLLKEDLYGGIHIDDNGDSCPKCSAFLSIDQLMMGWTFCSFTEYTTQCPHCKNKFIPRFVVNSKSPGFMGTQGLGTPLYCEFFSPWVLRREVYLATGGGDDMDAVLNVSRRSENDFNAKLWWNMIVLFRKQKLPFTFLLQSHFSSNLTI